MLRSLMILLLAIPALADYKPGGNLITDGIPAVPDALAAKLRRYNDWRSATLFDWHPTKREICLLYTSPSPRD